MMVSRKGAVLEEGLRYSGVTLSCVSSSLVRLVGVDSVQLSSGWAGWRVINGGSVMREGRQSHNGFLCMPLVLHTSRRL